ncbi:MAG: PQQ-dependent sugar dehydrogenase [Gammaproteobacteria bacterium]|nr:PQQ-dependent sugar dehydrogenase [Gammaproteobacteria bacterium]
MDLSRIRLPDGFHIQVYAENVENARAMVMSPKGILFVGSRKAGKVYALVDADGDHLAERQHLIDFDLRMPTGIDFRAGALYVADLSRILRYDEIETRLENPPAPVTVVDDYPSETHHGWRYLRFGPDGKMYVPIGAPCNICDREGYGVMTRRNADGSGREVVARGLRNTVGFDFHPRTGDLWFTDNGRDWLGDDSPPDELNHVSGPGQHFGYPYCHGGDIPDPDFGAGRSCADYRPPARRLGAHVAALGMRFYTGSMFPEAYRGQIFIAEHGSWNRSQKVGYRISLVRLAGDRVTAYEPFAVGWLQGDAAWGRPADVIVAPDGALLVSDDTANVIYRIYYKKQ